MGISIKETEDNTVIIVVSGKFTFELQREFRTACEQHSAKKHFILDLRETDYLDSSALGMILILNDAVKKTASTLKIINCQMAIKKIFELTNLQQIINIA